MKSKVFITTAPSPQYANGKRNFPGTGSIVDNIGLGYLEASLEGVCDCATLDAGQLGMNHDETLRFVMRELEGYDNKIIGISAYTVVEESALFLAKLIRRVDPQVKLIAGGYGPSLYPGNYANFDYVCLGEGDLLLPALVKAMINGKAPNESRGIAIKNALSTRNRLKDLDKLSWPKRKGYTPLARAFGNDLPEIAVQTSRGCIGRCGFCGRYAVQPGYRERSVDSVVDEVVSVNNNRFNEIVLSLMDLNFLSNAARIGSIVDKLKEKGVTAYLSGCTRVTDIIRWKDFVSEYKKSFMKIDLGVESFDDKFLERWKKGYTSKEALEGIKILDENKITYGLFMVGVDARTNSSDMRQYYQTLSQLPNHVWTHMVDFPTKRIIYDFGGTREKYTSNQKTFSDIADVINFKSIHQTFRNVFYLKLKDEMLEDKRYTRIVNKTSRYLASAFKYAIGLLDHKAEENKEKLNGNDAGVHQKIFGQVAEQIRKEITDLVRTKTLTNSYREDAADLFLDLSHFVAGAERLKFGKQAFKMQPDKPRYAAEFATWLKVLSPKYRFKKIQNMFKDTKPEQYGNFLASWQFGADVCSYLQPKYNESSLRLLEASLEKNPTGTSLIFVGNYHWHKKEYQKAQEYCKQYHKLFPLDILGLMYLAAASHTVKDEKQVKECYRTLYRLGAPKKLLTKKIFASCLTDSPVRFLGL